MMERIISNSADHSSNKARDLDGAYTEDASDSLQTILKKQPSMVPYSMLLSSIAFLAMTWSWAINAKVEEVSELHYSTVPAKHLSKESELQATDVVKIPVQQNQLTFFVGQTLEQALEPTNYQHEFKIIPKKYNHTEMRYQTNDSKKVSKKVQIVHIYRVADMFFEK